MPKPILTPEQKKELDKEIADKAKSGKQELVERTVQRYFKEKFNETISLDNARKLGHGLVAGASKFRTEFRKHTVTALITAFGLLIALSWQELVKGIVTAYVKTRWLENWPYTDQLINALVVTVLAVLAIMALSSWANKSAEV